MSGSVSVIIPAYNSSSTIVRALESVLSQTNPVEEIIIVDDYSTDDTLNVVDLFFKQNSYAGKIKVVSNSENLGAATARNVGWDLAESEFIAFLDSDDSWHPQKIELQLKVMIKFPSVALCSSSYSVGRVSAKLYNETQLFDSLNRVSSFKHLLSNKFSTPCVMIRRSLEFRFLEGKRYSEDFLLWSEIVVSGLPSYKIDLPLVVLYKEEYGVSGLSSHIYRFQIEKYKSYYFLYRKKYISFWAFGFFCATSTAAFFRRCVKLLIRD